MVDTILNHLFISSESEKFLAHYTNLTVSKLLLKLGNNNPISNLRLNTVNLMNDPEEGFLLNNLLGIESILNTVDLAFISCFTLHHDSLNQFRLYAKEVYQEATGLSLVLSKDFFAKTHNTADVVDSSQIKKTINFDEEAEKDSISVAKDSLSQKPVYRCIYFDPTSGLLKVAQREEWSFRREFKLGHGYSWFDKNIESDEKWKEYEKKLAKSRTM